MATSRYEVTLFERQVGMALLAHIARGDDEAVSASLAALEHPTPDLRPTHVVAALLKQFQIGMETSDTNELADWFVDQAQTLAERRAGAA